VVDRTVAEEVAGGEARVPRTYNDRGDALDDLDLSVITLSARVGQAAARPLKRLRR
jgi:hypothetical protein